MTKQCEREWFSVIEDPIFEALHFRDNLSSQEKKEYIYNIKLIIYWLRIDSHRKNGDTLELVATIRDWISTPKWGRLLPGGESKRKRYAWYKLPFQLGISPSLSSVAFRFRGSNSSGSEQSAPREASEVEKLSHDGSYEVEKCETKKLIQSKLSWFVWFPFSSSSFPQYIMMKKGVEFR